MSSPIGDVFNIRRDTPMRSHPADQTVYHTPTPTSASSTYHSQSATSAPAMSTGSIIPKLELLLKERKQLATEQILLENSNDLNDNEVEELELQARKLDNQIARLQNILMRFDISTTMSNKYYSNPTLSNESNTASMADRKAHMTPVVPKELPKFGRNGIRKANEFVFRFEQILAVYEMDLDMQWERLLPSCMEQAEYSWIQNNLRKRHFSWRSAREAFLTHFEHPLRRSQLIQEIWSAKPHTGETLREYGDRFLKLTTDASISQNSEEVQEYFISTLPPAIQNSIQTTRLVSKISRSEDKLSLLDLTDMATSFSIISQPLYMHTKPITSNATYTKQMYKEERCMIHGLNCGHTDSTCRMQQKDLQRKHKQAYNINGAAPVYNKSFEPTCYNCNGPHYANKCPQNQDKPLMKSNNTKERSNFSSNNHIASKKVHVPENEYKALSNFCVPIAVEGCNYTALLDTGATHSIMDHQLCKSLKLSIVPKTGKVELAIKDAFVDRIGTTVPLSLSCGNITMKHAFEVMTLPTGTNFVIGCDLFNKLGFAISNVPVDFPTDRIKEEPLMDETPDLCSNPTINKNTKQIQDSITEELRLNKDVPEESFCNIPESIITLDTLPDATSWRRQYPLNPKYRHLVDEAVSNWLLKGTIKYAPTNTSFNSAITLAPKKDANGDRTLKRPCLDPRPLNKLLPDDRYPLPLIQDIFLALAGATIFTTLDLQDAYHKFLINPNDQHKTAFTWNNRQYMFVGAPFGLKPLSSKFQRVMHVILGDLKFVQVFVDDIIIYSSTPTEHIIHVKEVISRLTNANLKLNTNKCHFGVSEVVLLGFHVSTAGVTIDPKKLANVNEWPTPVTGRQIMSFLGFCNYFRDRIPIMSTLSAPLDKLRLRKRIEPADWTDECQTSFNGLKTILTKAPILCYPDFSLPFYVATDASEVGIGAVLYQEVSQSSLANPNTQPNRRYISFLARSLHPAERNYSATRKELLAIVFALQRFRQYLWSQPFILLTDHRALTFLHTQKELNPMLMGWLDIILEFNFKVVHHPGILNILPDSLSRLYPPTVRGEVNASIKAINLPIKTCIAQVNQSDLRIPPECEWSTLLADKHSLGHFGAEAMTKSLRGDGIAWPNIKKQAEDIVRNCQDCQRFNIIKHGFHPLTPIAASLPGDHYAIDLAGPFPTSYSGNHYLFVMVDIFSRFVLLRALPDKQMATIARTCVSIFSDFGYPRIIQSDNGSEFVNKLMKEITKVSGIDHRLVTPYHPRGNGIAERFVQTTVRVIKKGLHGKKASWDRLVPSTQLVTNLKIASINNTSPFTTMFARKHNNFKNYKNEDGLQLSDNDFKKRLQYVEQIVYPALTEAATMRRNKMSNHPHCKIIEPFPVGALVMTKDPIKKSKLDPLYEGPYTIIQRTKGGSYVLQDNTGALLTRNFAPSALKLISCDTPTTTDSFEVDSILNHRGNNGTTEYLVRWKNYNKNNNSWEPATNFDALDAIHKYWDRRGDKKTGEK